jgi:hypothetical protein
VQVVYQKIFLSPFTELDIFNKEVYEQLKQKLDNLDKAEDNIYTQEQLNQWQQEFDEFNDIVDLIPEEESQASQIKDNKENIMNCAVSQFKICNLEIIIFHAAAYCIFKRRFDYIKYLWDYHQPSDSNVNRVGRDIISSKLSNIILLYYQGIKKQRNNYWLYRFDDHHGNEIYLDQYFLLLLLRAFSKMSHQEKKDAINHFSLPQNLNSDDLFEIDRSVDKLVKILYKKDDECIIELGFKVDEAKKEIKSVLIPFLQRLKPRVKENLSQLVKKQKISPQKVTQFKENFIKGFYERSLFKKILNNCGLYENKITQNLEKKLNLFGIEDDIDKAAFLDEWYSYYTFNYGNPFATDEDLFIINELIGCCQKIDIDLFQNTLDAVAQDSQNYLIILINFWPSEYPIFSDNLIYRNYSNQYNLQPPDLQSFQGWYNHQDNYIPVFKIENRNSEEKMIVILNKSKLGKLIQYSPCEDGNLEHLCDIFRIKVTAFAEDNKLMNDWLNNPPDWLLQEPDWLLQEGDVNKQRNYLEQQVLIEIYEKFEFKKHPKFEGYVIRLPKEQEK